MAEAKDMKTRILAYLGDKPTGTFIPSADIVRVAYGVSADAAVSHSQRSVTFGIIRELRREEKILARSVFERPDGRGRFSISGFVCGEEESVPQEVRYSGPQRSLPPRAPFYCRLAGRTIP